MEGIRHIKKPDLEKILSEEHMKEVVRKLREQGVKLERVPNGLLVLARRETRFIPMTLPISLAKSDEGEYKLAMQLHSTPERSEIVGIDALENELVIYFKRFAGDKKTELWYELRVEYERLKQGNPYLQDLDSI